MSGLIGEFYVYKLNSGETLLVDPDPDIEGNLKLFQKERPEFGKKTFRGSKSIVLKEDEELIPAPVKKTGEFYEGLYFLVKKVL